MSEPLQESTAIDLLSVAQFDVDASSILDEPLTDEQLDQLLKIDPFRDMKEANFPRRSPLRELLRHETRLRRFKRGDLIVRAGDYGESAFMVVSGSLRVVVDEGLPDSLLGRFKPKKKGIFESIAQLWRNSKHPETRSQNELEHGENDELNRAGRTRKGGLKDVGKIIEDHKTVTLRQQGDFVGEIAALSRVPRTATVFVEEPDTLLLEFRWQGLRDLLKFDVGLRGYIDEIYRRNALSTQMRKVPMFDHLDEAQMGKVMEATEFSTYGNYQWSGDYKRMARQGDVRPEQEPVVVEEGEFARGIYLIRSGFARLSKKYGKGRRTLDYLGTGKVHGWEEVVHNWRSPEAPVSYRYSLSAAGYAHVLFVPAAVIEEFVLPTLPEEGFPDLVPIATDRPDEGLPEDGPTDSPRIGADMMEFLAENRFFNGTAAMVINLDRCTGCDDCVRACATTHDNNPRFLRRGPSHGGVMVANACMHCVDPVCLIGCPTGAIHRRVGGGQVVINQTTCIGCNFCANNCPYEAIRMVEVRDRSGALAENAEKKPIGRATKCDLCVEQHNGPACERACPHSALKRLDLTELDEFAGWLDR